MADFVVNIVSEDFFAPEPVVFILAACQPPGRAIAKAFAQRGMRVVLVDEDGKMLTQIATLDPDQIETLVIPDCLSEMTKVLSDAWGTEPLSMVVNLLPLKQSGAISQQMRNLVGIMRGLMRGLVAGQGCLVSLVNRPGDPFALVGQGMLAAMQTGSAALGRALAPHCVHVHVISLPRDTPEIAVDTLVLLSQPQTRQIASTTFDLG